MALKDKLVVDEACCRMLKRPYEYELVTERKMEEWGNGEEPGAEGCIIKELTLWMEEIKAC